jgi:hypothetical protein
LQWIDGDEDAVSHYVPGKPPSVNYPRPSSRAQRMERDLYRLRGSILIARDVCKNLVFMSFPSFLHSPEMSSLRPKWPGATGDRDVASQTYTKQAGWECETGMTLPFPASAITPWGGPGVPSLDRVLIQSSSSPTAFKRQLEPRAATTPDPHSKGSPRRIAGPSKLPRSTAPYRAKIR